MRVRHHASQTFAGDRRYYNVFGAERSGPRLFEILQEKELRLLIHREIDDGVHQAD